VKKTKEDVEEGLEEDYLMENITDGVSGEETTYLGTVVLHHISQRKANEQREESKNRRSGNPRNMLTHLVDSLGLR
jgi:hypothetical protein